MCSGVVVLFSHRNRGGVMNFEDKNKKWLADNMPFAFEEEKEEVEEVVINIPAAGKLYDDFEGE